MLAWVHLPTVLVERPERVLEQTVRVVLLLERDEAIPVLPERGDHACGELVPSEELRIAPLHMRSLSRTVETKPYRREGTAARYRLNRLSEPLFHRE